MPTPRMGTSSANSANHRSTAARSTSSCISSGDPHLGRAAAAAGQDDLSGAHQLFDPERLQHPLQRVDLPRIARTLDGKGPLADVDDLGAKDVADLHNL